jgi:tripartite-type tricarboxylate transporter receptor subunit TctC
VARLNREINAILQTPALAERMTSLGGQALPLTPEQFHQRAMEDSKRFGALIRERGIRGD